MIIKKRVYLDWASAAPVGTKAHKAFFRALTAFGNPSSPHAEGTRAKDTLEEARAQIAKLSGVKPSGVVFTSGATEANALAILGRVRRCESEGIAHTDMHMLYVPTMHSSVLKTVKELASLGVHTEGLPVVRGEIDSSVLSSMLRPETILVACDAVCGETGTRYDTRAIHTAIDKAGYAGKALLHVDASQLPLVEILERTRLGADLMTLDASKVGGVRGIGALVVQKSRAISPIVFGGGQEQGLRPGTEPVALAASFAAALVEAKTNHEAFSKRASTMRQALLKQLMQAIPDIVVNGGSHVAPHILNISIPGRDTDYLVMLLDAEGFAVSTKSACETDSDSGSRVVYALTSDKARSMSTLRISFGPTTRAVDIERFLKKLIESVRFLENR